MHNSHCSRQSALELSSRQFALIKVSPAATLRKKSTVSLLLASFRPRKQASSTAIGFLATLRRMKSLQRIQENSSLPLKLQRHYSKRFMCFLASRPASKPGESPNSSVETSPSSRVHDASALGFRAAAGDGDFLALRTARQCFAACNVCQTAFP